MQAPEVILRVKTKRDLCSMETYEKWLESCLQCGISAISTDTAARILSVVFLCSNNENFTHNVKLRADIEYICKRWHIGGGETPDPEFTTMLRGYSKEISDFMTVKDEDNPLRTQYPQWCHDLIFKRYNFKLFQ